ncbi:MAG TPA: imidazolonepropionase [Gammaproteobacteria bacterium]|nr:imidazolonepropionase [Gammaproteobacteria bacterium]
MSDNMTIWENARIATMQAGSGPYGLIERGSIIVAGEHIQNIGAADSIGLTAGDLDCKRIDCGGRLITPGLIDCHTHLIYAGNRANEFELRLAGTSYADIAAAGGGIQSTVQATRNESENVLFDAARQRLQRMINQGITTIEIKSGYGLNTSTELKILRVAQRLERELPVSVHKTFLGAHALPPEYSGQPDNYIDHVCQHMLPEIASESLIDSVDAFCETIAFSPDQTRQVFAAASDLGLPVRLHADQLSDSGGASLAAEFSALSADHLEYTSAAGAEALATGGTVAVLLPGAFYYLGETTRPPVKAFRKYGVDIAVATDMNPGSSPMESILLALNMACILFALTPEEALRGVTAAAALALGVLHDRGTLEPTKRADFALWNATEPAELCYPIGAPQPVCVVKSGQIAAGDLG